MKDTRENQLFHAPLPKAHGKQANNPLGQLDGHGADMGPDDSK
jgi:hypothetical protein